MAQSIGSFKPSMSIEQAGVIPILSEALPEFSDAIREHVADWPDDPMLYPLIGSLFQHVAELRPGKERERLRFARRAYELVDKMLSEGSPSVRDCFAIEMIEPLSGDAEAIKQHYPGLESILGPVGKEELAKMREWWRQHKEPIDIPGNAAAFASQAQFFVHLLEFVATHDVCILNMRYLHEVLGRLQAAASRIPAVAPDAEEIQGAGVKLTPSAAAKIREKLPINAYSVVFDPLEFDPLEQNSPQPVIAMLDDDLGDIYSDLTEGLTLYRAGQYQDALWQWHRSYYAHWGRHLSHAQSAIWQYLSEGNWT
jgi:hypothetical protein